MSREPIMPEARKLRAEFKAKYGDTKVFDYFYFGLADRSKKAVDEAAIKGLKKDVNVKWVEEKADGKD